MDAAKRAAVRLFCQGSGKSADEVRDQIRSVAVNARRCYALGWSLERIDDDRFAEMMLMDGCFLLQFMISMCPSNPNAELDEFMSIVHTRIQGIARDMMLLENQIPWSVLEALMKFRPATAPVPVERFLALMAAVFDVGNNAQPADRPGGDPSDQKPPPPTDRPGGDPGDHEPPPTKTTTQPPRPPPPTTTTTTPPPPPTDRPHLLGRFQRRQVGVVHAQDLRTPRLSSLSCTAVELAEMGVKLTASKTMRFGDMGMRKRRGRGVFGELSLAPVYLDQLTVCWLVNMAAYEACVGARLADNYAVSSYLSFVALLMNRDDDVRELRAKGIIHSTFSDKDTLDIVKGIGSQLRFGHRYYSIFQGIEEYKQQRWMWIVVHRFFYNNFKTIVTVLSIIGVLAGIFKTLLSLKSRPQ